MFGPGAASNQHPPTEFPTTMMVRNLPSDLSISELVSLLNSESFKGLYDYVHIAGDEAARTKSYGFINFVAPVVALKFKTVFTGKPIQGRDILRVAEVLYAKGHGFKQNITHRINLHSTKVFLLGSGDEVPLPRDTAMVQTVIELNRPAQERLRCLLFDLTEITDLVSLREELGLDQDGKPPSPVPVALAPSLINDLPPVMGGSSSAEDLASPWTLFVFPAALASVGKELETFEKLIVQRMHWQVNVVQSGSVFCDAVEALLTRAITDPHIKVAVLISPGDIAASAGESAVLLEFVTEELGRVDGVFTLSRPSDEGVDDLKAKVPNLRFAPNLFTLGTLIRKVQAAPSASAVRISVPSLSATMTPSATPTPGAAASTQQSQHAQISNAQLKRQVTITKPIFPSFARSLEQGGIRPILEGIPVGTKAVVLDVNEKQAVLFLQTQNYLPNGIRATGFLPMELTDYVV